MARPRSIALAIERQNDREDAVLAKVTETRDAPAMTLGRLRGLVVAAEARGEELIEILVPRVHKPRARQPIRIFVERMVRRG